MFDSVKSDSPLLLLAVLLIYAKSISFSQGGSQLHHPPAAHFPKIAVLAEFDVVRWEERRLVLEGNDEGRVQNSTLVLAEKRTLRRDPLDNFRHYKGGWNICSRHYLFEWRKYICEVSANNLCTSVGRLTTVFYNQMMAIVNVSYGLYHYGPFLVGLQDCSFVRDAFLEVKKDHCPGLRLYSKWIYVGLALVSASVMLFHWCSGWFMRESDGNTWSPDSLYL